MGLGLTEKQLLARASAVLATLLDLSEEDIEPLRNPPARVDLFLAAGGKKFALDVFTVATPGQVASHAELLVDAARKHPRRPIPLVVVPYMTGAAAHACVAVGASWFDLSGNAHIVAPGLRVIVGGRLNQFASAGRPASTFAPKSARVVRWLLEHPERPFTQREIARATGMTEGFASRIVARLEADTYIVRVDSDGEGDGSGAGGHGKAPIQVRDAALLLNAWRDEYQFDRHTLIAGHVAARSGDALTHVVSDTLIAGKVEHAATGLSAAWLLTHFAAFRIATFFVEAEPSANVKQKLGFREDARGANLWFVVPNDSGVFLGAEEHEGTRCVHPVQAYLDLKGHPERAPEAAEHLRAKALNWKRDV